MADLVFINGTNWLEIGTAPSSQAGLPGAEGKGKVTVSSFGAIRDYDRRMRDHYGMEPGVVYYNSHTDDWSGPGMAERAHATARRGAYACIDQECEMNYHPMVIGGMKESDVEMHVRLQTGRQRDGKLYSEFAGDPRPHIVKLGQVWIDQRKRFNHILRSVQATMPILYWRHPRHQRDFEDWMGGALHPSGGYAKGLYAASETFYFREGKAAFATEDEAWTMWASRIAERMQVFKAFDGSSMRRCAWLDLGLSDHPFTLFPKSVTDRLVATMVNDHQIDTIVWWYPGNFFQTPFDPNAGFLATTKEWSGRKVT